MEKDVIQQRIQALFSDSGIRQKDVAEALGVSQPTASKILREGTTKVTHLQKLAQLFTVSYDSLASGDDNTSDEVENEELGEQAALDLVDEDENDVDEDENDIDEDENDVDEEDVQAGLSAGQLALLTGLPVPQSESTV